MHRRKPRLVKASHISHDKTFQDKSKHISREAAVELITAHFADKLDEHLKTLDLVTLESTIALLEHVKKQAGVL